MGYAGLEIDEADPNTFCQALSGDWVQRYVRALETVDAYAGRSAENLRLELYRCQRMLVETVAIIGETIEFFVPITLGSKGVVGGMISKAELIERIRGIKT